MPVTINGTTGIAGIDGSASTPSVQGGDTNTGLFFPAADTVAIATGGTERARVDSSGNMSLGVTSVSGFDTGADNLVVGGGSGSNGITIYSGSTAAGTINFANGNSGSAIYAGGINYNHNTNVMSFYTTDGTGRMRIDGSGNILVGTGSQLLGTNSRFNVSFNNSTDYGMVMKAQSSGGFGCIYFVNSSGTVQGSITSTGSGATNYNTSSDYRLKHDIQPMTGALTKVMSLKPVTYKWNGDNSDGEGFIAHELAEVCPQAVTGEKDAVNEDGSIRPQGIDTSFLVATLTAAIQELNAKVDAQAAEIAALKGIKQ